MKKIVIDKNKCLGCGACVAFAPKSFKLGDDGKAQPVEPPGDGEAAIKEAIDNCPVTAIRREDSE